MRFRGLKKKEAGDGTERWGPRTANQGPGRTGQGLGETRMKGREGVLAVARQEAGSEGGTAAGEIARGAPLW